MPTSTFTGGVATEAAHTIARVACSHCGFVGPENQVCTTEISPIDKPAIDEARARCANKAKSSEVSSAQAA